MRVHLSVRDHPPVHIENLAKQCERENTNYREHILLHLEALVKIFLGSIGRRGQLRKLALALFDLQSSVFQCTQYAEHILLGAHSIKPPVSYEEEEEEDTCVCTQGTCITFYQATWKAANFFLRSSLSRFTSSP